MAGPKTAQKKSMTFPIVITVVAVAMIAIIVVSVSSEKKSVASKIETSPSVQITPSTVDGEIGEAELSDFDDAAAAGNDPSVGAIVPTFTARNFQDEAVTIAPEGKPYAIAFLAHWCPRVST
jgi:ABC-type lipoprotein release transport system permease subunit